MSSEIFSHTILDGKLFISFNGELNLYLITLASKEFDLIDFSKIKYVIFDFTKLTKIDTAGAIFIELQKKNLLEKNITVEFFGANDKVLKTIQLIKDTNSSQQFCPLQQKRTILEKLGLMFYENYLGFIAFITDANSSTGWRSPPADSLICTAIASISGLFLTVSTTASTLTGVFHSFLISTDLSH